MDKKFPRKILRLIPKAEHTMVGHIDSLVEDTSVAMLLAKFDKDLKIKTDKEENERNINWSDSNDWNKGMSLYGQNFWTTENTYNFEVNNVEKVEHVILWALQCHEQTMRDFRIGRLSDRAKNQTTYETKDLHL